jgi:hypothetical protein
MRRMLMNLLFLFTMVSKPLCENDETGEEDKASDKGGLGVFLGPRRTK